MYISENTNVTYTISLTESIDERIDEPIHVKSSIDSVPTRNVTLLNALPQNHFKKKLRQFIVQMEQPRLSPDNLLKMASEQLNLPQQQVITYILQSSDPVRQRLWVELGYVFNRDVRDIIQCFIRLINPNKRHHSQISSLNESINNSHINKHQFSLINHESINQSEIHVQNITPNQIQTEYDRIKFRQEVLRQNRRNQNDTGINLIELNRKNFGINVTEQKSKVKQNKQQIENQKMFIQNKQNEEQIIQKKQMEQQEEIDLRQYKFEYKKDIDQKKQMEQKKQIEMNLQQIEQQKQIQLKQQVEQQQIELKKLIELKKQQQKEQELKDQQELKEQLAQERLKQQILEHQQQAQNQVQIQEAAHEKKNNLEHHLKHMSSKIKNYQQKRQAHMQSNIQHKSVNLTTLANQDSQVSQQKPMQLMNDQINQQINLFMNQTTDFDNLIEQNASNLNNQANQPSFYMTNQNNQTHVFALPNQNITQYSQIHPVDMSTYDQVIVQNNQNMMNAQINPSKLQQNNTQQQQVQSNQLTTQQVNDMINAQIHDQLAQNQADEQEKNYQLLQRSLQKQAELDQQQETLRREYEIYKQQLNEKVQRRLQLLQNRPRSQNNNSNANNSNQNQMSNQNNNEQMNNLQNQSEQTINALNNIDQYQIEQTNELQTNSLQINEIQTNADLIINTNRVFRTSTERKISNFSTEFEIQFEIALKNALMIQFENENDEIDFVGKMGTKERRELWIRVQQEIQNKTTKQLRDYFQNTYQKRKYKKCISNEDKKYLQLLNDEFKTERPSYITDLFLEHKKEYFRHNVLMYIINLRRFECNK
ncbi:Hypothetical_protein [Hexamita inflata]|uniref:Hypothetical_protein n=1 Tax=Hexamita inflata TaxID=28002 RepID=A0AA86Q4Y1_9EUKA|nr:Hypothetical protein HINF_LOCUS36909 [Hexamita inflata]CAI9952395.1 Hypothetical protein HINF_LOCUS40040 [Hexamita inflata]CAI9963962.1 Hypothetical protein HINF_LOCUS51607 [Hexamita inflata]